MDLVLDNQTKSYAVQNYRQDIDGLRAVAVLLVILFHAGLSYFPSGFIGVDIFFTISGFLITGKVISEIERGTFSLTNFIKGRLWRLQPALLVTILGAIIVATYCYIPDDYTAFAKSAKYTTLFLSNQYFDKLSAAYASPDSDYFLLLHTWSLAIEWQWYFFFALFATILTLLASKFKRKLAYKPFLYGWLLLTLTATIVVILISLYSPSQHYYSLNMRAFEFLIGGSVALLKDRVQITNRWITNTLAVVAIAVLICTSGLSIPVETYPNSWTLLVCLASATLLINQNTFVNRTLQLAPINYTGKISYSLYLWHWPIFAAFNYLEFSLSGRTLCIALVITAGLAVLTYHGIEERFRRVKLSFAKSIILLVLLPLTVCTGLYSLTVKTNGLPQRFSDEYNRSLQLLNSAAEKAASRDGCLSGSLELTDCQFGDHEGSKKAFLIGDSNANQFWGFYDVLAKDAGTKMYSLTTSSCLTLPGIYQFDWWKYKGVKYQECHDNAEQYYDYIKSNHFDYVIIGHVWSNYFAAQLITDDADERSEALSDSRYEMALRTAIRTIIDAGSKPIIMFTIATMPRNYQNCINQHVIHRRPFDINECDMQNPANTNGEKVTQLMSKMKTEFPTLTFIDPKSIQCISGKCITNIDGVTVYRDVGHLTDYASYKFGQLYLNEFGNPLK